MHFGLSSWYFIHISHLHTIAQVRIYIPQYIAWATIQINITVDTCTITVYCLYLSDKTSLPLHGTIN